MIEMTATTALLGVLAWLAALAVSVWLTFRMGGQFHDGNTAGAQATANWLLALTFAWSVTEGLIYWYFPVVPIVMLGFTLWAKRDMARGKSL